MEEKFVSMECVGALSDRELLSRCELYGREVLTWRNKFRALLPEVEKRKLYLQKGYGDVYEFGARLAGLSMAQVAESLNIVERLRDKPALWQLLESGTVSVNKITPVMSIATPDNERELADKVQMMSVSALKVFARDIQQEAKRDSEKKICQTPKAESLDVQKLLDARDVSLPADIANKIHELRQKGIDVESMMREMFAKREQEIAQKKHAVAESLPAESGRHVPKRVKDIIHEEYGTKCAKSGCNKPSKELHHTARYGLTKSHDPNLLAPLCREHHEIAHKMDVRMVECVMGKR